MQKTENLVDSEYQFHQGNQQSHNEFSQKNAFYGTTDKDIDKLQTAI